jgi:hypothetical protein
VETLETEDWESSSAPLLVRGLGPRGSDADLRSRLLLALGLLLRQHVVVGGLVPVGVDGVPLEGLQVAGGGRGAARRWMKRSPLASHAFLNENQTTTCSRSRAQLRLTSKEA